MTYEFGEKMSNHKILRFYVVQSKCYINEPHQTSLLMMLEITNFGSFKSLKIIN